MRGAIRPPGTHIHGDRWGAHVLENFPHIRQNKCFSLAIAIFMVKIDISAFTNRKKLTTFYTITPWYGFTGPCPWTVRFAVDRILHYYPPITPPLPTPPTPPQDNCEVGGDNPRGHAIKFRNVRFDKIIRITPKLFTEHFIDKFSE